ncbi:MAG: [Fe] hydrogenase subunit HymD [Parcubacteria group bacterium Athens0714_12]|nr:MAG: [Fe] hydrogenase subunit HymD [Parcubacteria group bacterium Athens0714_12]
MDKHNAILIGLIPSLIALSTGLLPPVLAPMIPFIMAGNTILILTFSYLKEKNFWLGVISASFLKFIFLFSASSIVINLLLKKEIAAKVALMMSWPQLLTALSGGLLAYLFLKFFKNNL